MTNRPTETRPAQSPEQARSLPLAAALADRVMVHARWDAGGKLIAALPQLDGLVLCGDRAGKAVRQLREGGFQGLLILDQETYRVKATPEAPFVLPPGDGLFAVSLEQRLQGQRDCGASLALTPTGYLDAGDRPALAAAVNIAARTGRDDVLFSAPIAGRWLKGEYIDTLIAELARLQSIPKAVLLGGQFNPQSTAEAVVNLRRLLREAAPLAVFRTDLAGLDAIAHGGLAASIGTSASLRHVIPPDQYPRSGNPTDRSPTVLVPELMAFFRGSTIARRFANTRPITCSCPACGGRALDTFRDHDDTAAAGAHLVHICAQWTTELLAQPTLAHRADWWRTRCRDAIEAYPELNKRLHHADAFEPPTPLNAWASLPA